MTTWLKPDEVSRIESMLADGWSIAEIARTIGRNRQALSRRFRGRGWTRQQVVEWQGMQKTLKSMDFCP